MNDVVSEEDELEKAQRIRRLSELFCLAVFIFVLQLFGEPLITSLRYDRDLIEAGEFWRLFSANFVHLSSNHMLMNLSVFVLASLLFRPNTGTLMWLCTIVILSLAVGLGLYFFDEQVVRYVGFSGVLYGLFVYGLLISLKDNPWLYLLCLIFVVYKVIAQQGPNYNPQDVIEFIGGNVIASAHLYGLLIGLGVGLTQMFVTGGIKNLPFVRS